MLDLIIYRPWGCWHIHVSLDCCEHWSVSITLCLYVGRKCVVCVRKVRKCSSKLAPDTYVFALKCCVYAWLAWYSYQGTLVYLEFLSVKGEWRPGHLLEPQRLTGACRLESTIVWIIFKISGMTHHHMEITLTSKNTTRAWLARPCSWFLRLLHC